LLTVGALLLALTAGMAAAGTGVGGVFNLGKTNAVNAISVLKGSAKGAMVRLVNSGPGTALQLVVKPGQAPMTVNSAVKVANLNSDKLDGLDQSAFLRSGGKATDSDRLDGKDSSAFLGATQKAADSAHADNADRATNADNATKAGDANTLDGKDSSAFFSGSTYLLSETKTSVIAQDTTVALRCDEGDRALSGGYEGLNPPNTFIISNGPSSSTAGGSPDGWKVSWRNEVLADEVTVYTVCADFPPLRTP
jgi:hypothetical protein